MGPSRIRWQLEQQGIDPLPGRSSVCRALVRHCLVEAKKRKRRREDYRRWERGRSMELWQMDVMGRVFLAGEPVEVVVAGGLVDIRHAGVVVATHAQRLREDQADRKPRARVARRARDATAELTVTRLADGAGVVSFAGTRTRAGRRWARTPVDVTIVAGPVQLAKDGKVIRVHPIRQDRSRELGAFANPKGRPRRKNSATGNVA